MSQRRRGNQDVEGVKGGVEQGMKRWIDWRGVMGSKYEPASKIRADQQQVGAGGCVPVADKDVLYPPQQSCPPGTLTPTDALLGQQHASGLLVMPSPKVVSSKLFIRLRQESN